MAGEIEKYVRSILKKAGKIPNGCQTPGPGRLPDKVLRLIAKSLCAGTAFLHKNGKLHRDIKPSNVLVNKQGKIKVSDFGVAVGLQAARNLRATVAGSVPYMSPERMRGDEYGMSSDTWSIGLTVLMCALGWYPLGNPKNQFSLCEVLDHDRFHCKWLSDVTTEDGSEKLDPELIEFCKITLENNPDKRPTPE
eukprot:gene19341-10_t